jgi:hypothetical protein
MKEGQNIVYNSEKRQITGFLQKKTIRLYSKKDENILRIIQGYGPNTQILPKTLRKKGE